MLGVGTKAHVADKAAVPPNKTKEGNIDVLGVGVHPPCTGVCWDMTSLGISLMLPMLDHKFSSRPGNM